MIGDAPLIHEISAGAKELMVNETYGHALSSTPLTLLKVIMLLYYKILFIVFLNLNNLFYSGLKSLAPGEYVDHDLIHLNSKICFPEILFFVLTNLNLVFLNSDIITF
jgi:hypothetical protein